MQQKIQPIPRVLLILYFAYLHPTSVQESGFLDDDLLARSLTEVGRVPPQPLTLLSAFLRLSAWFFPLRFLSTALLPRAASSTDRKSVSATFRTFYWILSSTDRLELLEPDVLDNRDDRIDGGCLATSILRWKSLSNSSFVAHTARTSLWHSSTFSNSHTKEDK